MNGVAFWLSLTLSVWRGAGYSSIFDSITEIGEKQMEQKSHEEQVNGDSRWDSVNFRHLSTFQRVYQEKNYTNAGQDISAARKSVIRMMRNLERSFDCELFKEGAHGELTPSAFAERLNNDLRFLNAAMHRMENHIAAVHENGRILRVGCSTAVFRTREFRHLFRGFQSFDGIHTRYSPISLGDAGKALVSGKCDVYIGCWAGTGSRFVTQAAGDIAFRLYERKSDEAAPGKGKSEEVGSYIVVLDGDAPMIGGNRHVTSGWKPLDEAWWLYWLDHPEECPPGTRILGPDVQIDSERWELQEDMMKVIREPLRVSFLRQHPYEFLPALMKSIQSRSANE